MDPKTHWENIYETKLSNHVSWYTPHLKTSLQMISSLNLPKNVRILDVGGGASTFPDDLLKLGFKNITVLDISLKALEVSKNRLATNDDIRWLEADITSASLNLEPCDLWHDRAVFHFLTKSDDRQRYLNNLKGSLKVGGYLLMASFGPNGPMKCSGLDIVRYSVNKLKRELGSAFCLEQDVIDVHQTPFETTQEFLYCLFKKGNG